MEKVIRITSARHGFIRGGVAHPSTPTDYPLGYFTEEQAAAISAEPMLTVELAYVDEADLPRPPLVVDDLRSPLGSNLLNLPLGGGRSIQLGEVIAFAHVASEVSLNDWNALTPEHRAEWMQGILDDAFEDQRVFMEEEAKATAAASGATPDAGASMTSASGTAPKPDDTKTSETPAQKKAREKKEADEKKSSATK